MGILSEIDMMNRDAEDDAFEVSSDSETVDSFSEEFEPVETQKQEPQAEDAEEARKKAEFDAAEPRQHLEFLPLLRKGQLSRRLPVLYGRCRQYDFLHGQ